MPRLTFLAIVCVAGVLATVPLRAQCTPDDSQWYPTPTLKWDAAPGAVAYRIYWRWLPDGDWCCNSGRLDCQVIPNEDADGTYTVCPGVDYDVPVQRFTNTQLYDLAFCVKAIGESGEESAECSDPVNICMPPMRRY